MMYLVVGEGTYGKSPARFTDEDQAFDYARGLARAGLSAGVYTELAWYSANQTKEEKICPGPTKTPVGGATGQDNAETALVVTVAELGM
jgi:hypothetical protein